MSINPIHLNKIKTIIDSGVKTPKQIVSKLTQNNTEEVPLHSLPKIQAFIRNNVYEKDSNKVEPVKDYIKLLSN